MSLLLTLANLGMQPRFMAPWLGNWALACLFAVPAAILAIPVARPDRWQADRGVAVRKLNRS